MHKFVLKHQPLSQYRHSHACVHVNVLLGSSLVRVVFDKGCLPSGLPVIRIPSISSGWAFIDVSHEGGRSQGTHCIRRLCNIKRDHNSPFSCVFACYRMVMSPLDVLEDLPNNRTIWWVSWAAWVLSLAQLNTSVRPLLASVQLYSCLLKR